MNHGHGLSETHRVRIKGIVSKWLKPHIGKECDAIFYENCKPQIYSEQLDPKIPNMQTVSEHDIEVLVMKPHETRAVRVWVDVDAGIAELVMALQWLPCVRTHSSCQGTIGEGGSSPYRPYVHVSWTDPKALEMLRAEFDLSEIHENEQHCYVHPRS